ncbi:hypothetical protein RF11_02074 [Thelohanellus kitauei]|uniref:Uncharacterized protein n=1 Tax=Thelohanellus kitauei TaxID=669202 RepID=A0A0C2JA22_THEKT|nr:hypothetical protein RF11_15802 [Thelohanellus kitauei]KII66430.1 hypothetical protein RF11_02074 [Thelohanellus kitauei]
MVIPNEDTENFQPEEDKHKHQSQRDEDKEENSWYCIDDASAISGIPCEYQTPEEIIMYCGKLFYSTLLNLFNYTRLYIRKKRKIVDTSRILTKLFNPKTDSKAVKHTSMNQH